MMPRAFALRCFHYRYTPMITPDAALPLLPLRLFTYFAMLLRYVFAM